MRDGMGDIGMIKEGACLEAPLKGKKGRRRRSRSQGHQQRSRGLKRGDKQYIQSKQVQYYAWQVKSNARGVLTQCYTIPMEEDNIRESLPEVWHFWTDETEGEGCMFAMLRACDWQTDGVFRFVSSFWATFMYKTFSSELRIVLYDFL